MKMEKKKEGAKGRIFLRSIELLHSSIWQKILRPIDIKFLSVSSRVYNIC